MQTLTLPKELPLWLTQREVQWDSVPFREVAWQFKVFFNSSSSNNNKIKRKEGRKEKKNTKGCLVLWSGLRKYLITLDIQNATFHFSIPDCHCLFLLPIPSCVFVQCHKVHGLWWCRISVLIRCGTSDHQRRCGAESSPRWDLWGLQPGKELHLSLDPSGEGSSAHGRLNSPHSGL